MSIIVFACVEDTHSLRDEMPHSFWQVCDADCLESFATWHAVARATPVPTELLPYDLDVYKLPKFKTAGS